MINNLNITSSLLPSLNCKRCEYSWYPKKEAPKRCPRCKSLLWNKTKQLRRWEKERTNQQNNQQKGSFAMVLLFSDGIKVELLDSFSQPYDSSSHPGLLQSFISNPLDITLPELLELSDAICGEPIATGCYQSPNPSDIFNEVCKAISLLEIKAEDG